MRETPDAKASDPSLLAIAGGPPALPGGPPSWPLADDRLRQALESAWSDGSWGRYEGRHQLALTRALSEVFQTEHVALCCSGTFAVELALRALDVGAGDETLLAGYDFPGNYRAIEAVGARIALVDLRPGDWTIDLDQLTTVDPRPKAAVVSHLHGSLAPMRRIMEWAESRGVRVVEDACQTPGAVVDGRPAGAWGHVGVLSFGGSKLLSAGRGGAILTHDAATRQRAKIYCERGNHAFPLSELQAAVLLPQLDQLAQRNALRLANVRLLDRLLTDAAGLSPRRPTREGDQPAFYKLAWTLDLAETGGRSREDFVAAVRAEGVALDVGFRGFMLRAGRRCRAVGELTESRRAAERAVLLHHPVLLEPEDTIHRVAGAIRKVLRAFNAGVESP